MEVKKERGEDRDIFKNLYLFTLYPLKTYDRKKSIHSCFIAYRDVTAVV